MNNQTTAPGMSAGQRGVALVMALIITMVVFLLVGSTLYLVNTSTAISGAGKRYATACEAADGAIEVMKDSINRIMYSYPIEKLPLDNKTELISAIANNHMPVTVTLDLNGTSLFSIYTARITVERLYSKALPGGRLEYARSAGGSGGTAIYFRISTIVTGPGNAKAESTAMYRFVG